MGIAQKQIGPVLQRNCESHTATCEDPRSLASWSVTFAVCGAPRCAGRQLFGFRVLHESFARRSGNL